MTDTKILDWLENNWWEVIHHVSGEWTIYVSVGPTLKAPNLRDAVQRAALLAKENE